MPFTSDQPSTSPDQSRSRANSKPQAKKTYSGKLTPLLMVQLAAPHTWPASVTPVLLAAALAVGTTGKLSVITVCVLLAISVLMQSAVNTINDYFDYVKGTDTEENQDDPTDAVLVYNDVDPKEARNLAIAFLAGAFILGLYNIFRAGWVPLVIAIVGAFIVFLYSGGRTPISYLPIGELVSGITMGGLITLASYQALTLVLDWSVLLFAVPVILSIGLIMFTNNTCDIEKDIEAQRKTLSVVLGRERSVALYHGIMIVAVLFTVILVGVYFPRGLLICLFMALACIGQFKALLGNPLISSSRGPAMGQVTTFTVLLCAFYVAAIFFHCGCVITL